MSLRFNLIASGLLVASAALLLALVVRAPAAAPAQERAPAADATPPLRVCADPNNLPFSNERGEGFENEIARLVAKELRRPLEYTWWPQRRGFARNTLRAGECDIIVGIPSSYELAWPTRPYYRSTYVFVSRRDRRAGVQSLDDAALRTLRIGLHVIGDDYSNVPPAQALANRGIISNVHGYSIYGDYSKPNPPADLIDAVARGEVDVAIAWGPLAGFFAQRAAVPLDVVPVSPEIDLPFLPFVYDISMGTRREDTALHEALDEIIARRRGEIAGILRRYGVPLVGPAAASIPEPAS